VRAESVSGGDAAHPGRDGYRPKFLYKMIIDLIDVCLPPHLHGPMSIARSRRAST
jgi:predicted dehydrogenase